MWLLVFPLSGAKIVRVNIDTKDCTCSPAHGLWICTPRRGTHQNEPLLLTPPTRSHICDLLTRVLQCSTETEKNSKSHDHIRKTWNWNWRTDWRVRTWCSCRDCLKLKSLTTLTTKFLLSRWSYCSLTITPGLFGRPKYRRNGAASVKTIFHIHFPRRFA